MSRTQVGRPPGGKFPQGQAGKTRDKIGAFAGICGRTVEKITEAARRETDFGRQRRKARNRLRAVFIGVRDRTSGI